MRAYNGIIRSLVDYQQFFYVDMEPHIDPHNPHVYLLPDDQHLNRDGHRLISRLLFSFVCAQMYLKKAQLLLQDGKTQQAHEWLLQAFRLYPHDLSVIKSNRWQVPPKR